MIPRAKRLFLEAAKLAVCLVGVWSVDYLIVTSTTLQLDGETRMSTKTSPEELDDPELDHVEGGAKRRYQSLKWSDTSSKRRIDDSGSGSKALDDPLLDLPQDFMP